MNNDNNAGNREDLIGFGEAMSDFMNRGKTQKEWQNKMKERAKKVKNPDEHITDKIKLGQMNETLKELRNRQKHPK